ncbi:Pyridoxamine 5'-phosphate oxidase OS=Streptomyces fumanus OX=67302 GN=GCM10018772_31170 PE=4 SV=1 [Streptomyces fumanus]
MALTREEREQFLAEPHIAALAVDAGAGRAPLTVPIWYQYAAGDDTLWIMTGSASRKYELIKAAGRFSLLVDRLEPSIRYVSVEGPAVDDPRHPGAAPGGLRPVPAGREGRRLCRLRLEHHGDQVIVRMRPERWVSSDLGSV